LEVKKDVVKPYDNILQLIGHTPMVKLNRIPGPKDATIYAKLEQFNPAGSVKDRIALSMIEEAEKEGKLKPGSTIVEPTSGNTGIGLAMVGAVKGYRVILVLSEDMSYERRVLLSSYGAEVVLTPSEEGMRGSIVKAEELVRDNPDYFMPQQFNNPANPDIHRKTTAREILESMEGMGIDAFVAGVGTGGTITGVGEVLKENYPEIRIVGVEPAGSPVLSGGEPGPHLIQGIGAGFIPNVLNTEIIDQVITVTDEEAYHIMKRLAQEEALLVGISSGANVCGAQKVAQELGKGKKVVVILPDTGERYYSLEKYF
jgi:cysteine synthase A